MSLLLANWVIDVKKILDVLNTERHIFGQKNKEFFHILNSFNSFFQFYSYLD